MGNSKSKSNEKLNKNHNTKKGFQLGISFGKDSLTMEGNIQIGWTKKTVKNYSRIPGSDDTSLTPLLVAAPSFVPPDQSGEVIPE